MMTLETDEDMKQEIHQLTGASMEDVETFYPLVDEHGTTGAIAQWAMQKGFETMEVEKACAMAMANQCLRECVIINALIQTGISLGARPDAIRATFSLIGQVGQDRVRGAGE